MRKLFTLFTAILFAGSIFASVKTSTLTFTKACGGSGVADDKVEWTITSDGAESTFDNTKGIHYGTSSAAVTYVNLSTEGITGKITKVVVKASGASGTTAKICVKVGDEAFQCGEKDTVALTASATDYTFEGEAEGKILISLHHASATKKAIYCKSVAVTYEKDDSEPSIEALGINFGSVQTDDETAVIDTILEVTAANLTAPISVAVSAESLEITEDELPATGGTLHIKITAPAGAFAEKITLTSGETEKVVNITGKVLRNMVAPGTPATFAPHSNATKVDSITVNGHKGIKVGTSNNDGNVGIVVPAKTEKVYFFAAAWAGAPGKLNLSSEGATLSASEVTVKADAGVAGSSPKFVLKDLGENECIFEIELSNVTEETEVVVASGTARRFVIWGATYVLAPDPTAIDNTASDTKAVKTIVNGQLLITRDGKTYNVLGTVVR